MRVKILATNLIVSAEKRNGSMHFVGVSFDGVFYCFLFFFLFFWLLTFMGYQVIGAPHRFSISTVGDFLLEI